MYLPLITPPSLPPGLTTPVGLKLRLVPILTLMRHDIAAATQVRELCLKLLPSYPSLSFVATILQTLTKLATETLVHVPSQVREINDTHSYME